MRTTRWLVAGVAAAAGLAVGGTWVYLHVVEGKAPPRLALTDATAPATDVTTADGTWTVTDESQVGYRVGEVLFGQSATAVGRTNQVTGSLTIAGTSVTKAAFTVDMASVRSDQSRRDGQYRSRIMDVGTYPTSSFTLTKPIDLRAVPANGVTIDATATGRLTLRGVTKDVTFAVTARRSGARVEVNGAIHLVFGEWGIPSPSFGPAQVEDSGDLEFLLVLAR